MSPYRGIVQEGSKRASELGFPTINIPLGDATISGVYVARVSVGTKTFPAAAFADRQRKVLEAHILDTTLNLYGKDISVELCKKIRETQSFENDDALKLAIAQDIAAARDYFKSS